ncbi:hypothetical protein ACS0TY_026955 [Phlomoides rotata]
MAATPLELRPWEIRGLSSAAWASAHLLSVMFSKSSLNLMPSPPFVKLSPSESTSLTHLQVEQLLKPEEIAILEQNEAPNLEKLSTVSSRVFSTS